MEEQEAVIPLVLLKRIVRGMSRSRIVASWVCLMMLKLRNVTIMKQRFKVTVSGHFDKTVIVSARNAKQARGKAHNRVSKLQIGQENIRKDWTDVEELEG